jgi:hypothetical protein
MADLRILDAPEIPTNSITGQEKLPTGGSGNYSISLNSIANYTKTNKNLADNTSVDNKVNGVRQQLNTHTQNLSNPHQVTKGQIGLGNVDNTADADKPVSNSTQAAIISAVTPKTDKIYVDDQLILKADKVDTYTKQESSDLVNNSISTALTPVNVSLDLAKRGVINKYDSSLTYNSGERVVLTNGDIVKNTVANNISNPNIDMTGWVKVNASSQIFDESGLSQQKYNDALSIVAPIIESNTWQQNRDIIQAVNDAIFTSKKGGKIQLPSGTFNLKGVVLDSDVTIQGNNTWLVHPDGFDVDMFATRTFSTSGSIAKDSYTLTVADATGFKVGSMLGIECAGGLNIYQSTTLVNAVDSSQTTGFQFTNKTGFQNYSLGHGLLIVDSEIISYSSLDANGNLGGVVRGLLGSTATSHSAGAQIGISSRHVTEILNISGNTITLLNKAKFSVTSGNVLCGGLRTNVVDINVKGARQNNVGGHRWSPFRMTLHRFGKADYYVENSENGVYLQNSSDNDINIRAKDVSKTGTGKIGAAIWCYQGSNNNQLNLKQVGDCWCGVVLDDRSNIATEWIAECVGNYGTIVGNYNNYDIVTPLNTTLLNLIACQSNNFTVKAYNIYAPVYMANDGQGISAVGAFRKAEFNEINVYADTCVNPVSASAVMNNIFTVNSRFAENPKPVIGNGNVLYTSNYQSSAGMGFRALDGGYASPSYSFLNQTTTGMSLDVSGNLALYKEGIPVVTYGAGQSVIWREGTVINVGNSTGTKIGTGAVQKLAFYGATPIIRPTSTPAAATDAATTQALVNSIRQSLINLGLIG